MSDYLLGLLLSTLAFGSFECELCEHLSPSIANLLMQNVSQTAIKSIVFEVCKVESGFGYCSGTDCDELCHGVIESWLPVIDQITINDFTDNEACAIMLNCSNAGPFPWTPNPPNTTIEDKQPRTKSGVGYFLQLTDVHLDIAYKEGTNSICGLPLCCRGEVGKSSNASTAAGKFGTVAKCDTSPALWEGTIAFLKANISANLDFVLWTGDNPAHNIWEQSVSKDISLEQKMHNDMWKAFPGVPIYECLGNHEGYPIDEFFDPGVGDEWLYGNQSNWWELSIGDSAKTAKYGGFYTALIARGLRLVSFNTGFYQADNMWLQVQGKNRDMGGQLSWLTSIFKQARVLKETVWLIYHVPLLQAAEPHRTRYGNLFTEFKDIIGASFVGHTHTDQLNVFGAVAKDPYMVQYNPGALTTYSAKNPQFRVYQYDRATFEILDYTQWYTDIEKANLNGVLDWKPLYTAKGTLGLENLRPVSWMNWVNSLMTNDTAWNYYANVMAEAGIPINVDDSTRTNTVCHYNSGTSEEYARCNLTNFFLIEH